MAEQTPQPKQPEGRSADPAPPDEIDALAEDALERAAEAAETLRAEVGATGATDGDDGGASAGGLDLPSFDERQGAGPAGDLALLDDVSLGVKIELGRTRMYVADVLRLNESSVIELDKAAGDPVDIFVNERLIARGEVLVLDDHFCVRISEIIQPVSSG